MGELETIDIFQATNIIIIIIIYSEEILENQVVVVTSVVMSLGIMEKVNYNTFFRPLQGHHI